MSPVVIFTRPGSPAAFRMVWRHSRCTPDSCRPIAPPNFGSTVPKATLRTDDRNTDDGVSAGHCELSVFEVPDLDDGGHGGH